MTKNLLQSISGAFLALTMGAYAAQACAEPLTLEELIEVRDISALAPSPDGRSLALRVYGASLARNRIEAAWYVVSLDGAHEPRRVADAGDATLTDNGTLESALTLEAPTWSPDSRWIYYRALHDGEVQVWRVARDGGPQTQMTHDPADVRRFGLLDADLWYQVAATREAILAAEAEVYRDGTVLDESTLTQYPIARTFPYNGRMALMRWTDTGAFAPLLSDTPEQMRILEEETGQVRAPTQRERSRASQSGNRWQGARGTVEVVTLPSDATSEYVEWPQGQLSFTRGRRAERCTDPRCTGIVFFLRPIGWSDERTFVYTRRDVSGEGLFAWDIEANVVRTIEMFDGIIAGDRFATNPCAIRASKIFCVVAAAASAPHLRVFDVGDGTSRTLFDPNASFTSDRLGRAERIIVRNQVGDEASAFLITPANHRPGERLPLVITSYGCSGFLRGGSGDDVPEHLLAWRGFASVCLNGVPARDRPPRNPPPGEPYGEPRSLDMRRAIIDMLDARGLIDRTRVAVTGLSAGATQTAYAIGHSDLFRAAIITSQDYTDPIYYYLNGATDSMLLRDDTGAPLFHSEYWSENISSSGAAVRMHTPLLMLLSDSEYISMTQFYTMLRFHSRPVEMIIYPDEFHLKIQPQHRLSVYRRSLAWLQFWLQGIEGSEVSAIDYGRWRRLRDQATH